MSESVPRVKKATQAPGGILPLLLQRARRLAYSVPVLLWIARLTGVARWLRAVHDREALAHGILSIVVCGETYLFSVPSQRALMRVETTGAEEDMISRIRAVVSSNTVLFDVGANIGLISICAVPARYRHRMTVYAFEPESQNIAALRTNVQLNDLENTVQTIECAVTSSDGNVGLQVLGEAGTGTHRIEDAISWKDAGPEFVTVPAVALDSFCVRSGRVPTVIKIDVEGAECGVLDGMSALLANRVVQHIFLEVHPSILAALGHDPDYPAKRVATAGFTIAWRASRGDQIHFHFVRQ